MILGPSSWVLTEHIGFPLRMATAQGVNFQYCGDLVSMRWKRLPDNMEDRVIHVTY